MWRWRPISKGQRTDCSRGVSMTCTLSPAPLGKRCYTQMYHLRYVGCKAYLPGYKRPAQTGLPHRITQEMEVWLWPLTDSDTQEIAPSGIALPSPQVGLAASETHWTRRARSSQLTQ